MNKNDPDQHPDYINKQSGKYYFDIFENRRLWHWHERFRLWPETVRALILTRVAGWVAGWLAGKLRLYSLAQPSYARAFAELGKIQ